MPNISFSWIPLATVHDLDHAVSPGLYIVRVSEEGKVGLSGCPCGVPLWGGWRIVGLTRFFLGPRGGHRRPRWISCEKGGHADTWIRDWLRDGCRVELGRIILP